MVGSPIIGVSAASPDSPTAAHAAFNGLVNTLPQDELEQLASELHRCAALALEETPGEVHVGNMNMKATNEASSTIDHSGTSRFSQTELPTEAMEEWTTSSASLRSLVAHEVRQALASELQGVLDGLWVRRCEQAATAARKCAEELMRTEAPGSVQEGETMEGCAGFQDLARRPATIGSLKPAVADTRPCLKVDRANHGLDEQIHKELDCISAQVEDLRGNFSNLETLKLADKALPLPRAAQLAFRDESQLRALERNMRENIEELICHTTQVLDLESQARQEVELRSYARMRELEGEFRGHILRVLAVLETQWSTWAADHRPPLHCPACRKEVLL